MARGAPLLLLCAAVATLHRPGPVDGARVLAVSPISGKSHWNVMRGILRALTDRGHHVTVFTSHPDGDGAARANYTQVDVSGDIAPILQLDIGLVESAMTGHADLMRFVHANNRDACKKMYANAALRDLVADRGRRFDVLLVELMAVECMSHLATALPGSPAPPLIYVISPPLVSYAEHAVIGHHPNPAVVSHVLADHGAPRTWAQRFRNALLQLGTGALLRYEQWRAAVADPQPFDAEHPVKPALVFSNAHYLVDAARPLPPTVVQIGGIHLTPPEPIPHDILEFVENSPHGVIIFTLGSMVSTSSLPKNIIKIIMDVLGQVPQRVVFKHETDEFKVDIPKNIMTRKWLPQRDILMHPNVKLFISHGGISGIYEAVDAGVPILGFPVFYDQTRNLKTLEDVGMAIVSNLKTLTKDSFTNDISELINNEKYKRNAQIASKLFKDRPMSAADTVDYWTRYVVRHNGTQHLRPYAFNLTWYQYFLLDVFAITLAIILLMCYTTYKTLSFMKNLFFKTLPELKTKHD